LNDGQVTQVANSNLNVKFLGSTQPSNAENYNSTTSKILKGGSKIKKYSPVIVGSTTGIVSTYAMVRLWPERKTIGLALFGGGLWSAYQGFRLGRQ